MKRKVNTQALENRVSEMHEDLMKLEENTLYCLKSMKTLRRNLNDLQKALVKLSQGKKAFKEKVTKKSSKTQRSFNAMSFEERKKFLEDQQT